MEGSGSTSHGSSSQASVEEHEDANRDQDESVILMQRANNSVEPTSSNQMNDASSSYTSTDFVMNLDYNNVSEDEDDANCDQDESVISIQRANNSVEPTCSNQMNDARSPYASTDVVMNLDYNNGNDSIEMNTLDSNYSSISRIADVS